MPSLKENIKKKIEDGMSLSDQMKYDALVALSELPEGQWICHGDFHPENIILTDQGSVVLDWTEAACGHFLADVARSLVLLMAWLPQKLEEKGVDMPSKAIEQFLRDYRAKYMLLSGEEEDLLEQWLFPVAVARLGEAIPGEKAVLIKTHPGRALDEIKSVLSIMDRST